MVTPLFNHSLLPDELVQALSIPSKLWASPRHYAPNATGSRSLSVTAIEDRAERGARAVGMTELNDLTQLDPVGIPVFSSHCPGADDGLITRFAGKGFDPRQARVSAMMEAIERMSASPRDRALTQGTYQDLQFMLGNRVLHPADLIIYPRQLPVEVSPLHWTWAMDLGGGEAVLVPAAAVFHPYAPDRSGMLFINNSCGLASGSSMLEAVIQGMYEVIERDALSLARASNLFTSVEPDSITQENCAKLLAAFRREGVEVFVKELTTDVGVPVYAAYGNDTRRRNSLLINAGFGCHANRDVALTRALVELAQTRAVVLAGKREDLADMRPGDGSDYEEVLADLRTWFSHGEPRAGFTDLPSYQFSDLWEELTWLVERARVVCKRGPLVVDLSRPETGMPVVRVIMPGLECIHRDEKRFGKRCAEAQRLGIQYAKEKASQRSQGSAQPVPA